MKLIFNNKQITDTGIFNLEDSIEKFTFVNVIYSFGGSKNAVDSIKSTIFPVILLKQKYNCIFNLSASYVKTNQTILVEYLSLKFKNENQIEIFESKTTEPGSDVSNNRIYQIYAWN